MAGGLLLVSTRGQSDPFAAGTGWGIVLQGGFLFIFDLLHARGVAGYEVDPPLPTLDMFGGPEHAPFLLNGGEPAALLVHGFGGTPAEMRGLAEALNRAGWTAQGILLPGFGADMPSLFRRRHAEWTAAVVGAAAELEAGRASAADGSRLLHGRGRIVGSRRRGAARRHEPAGAVLVAGETGLAAG